MQTNEDQWCPFGIQSVTEDYLDIELKREVRKRRQKKRDEKIAMARMLEEAEIARRKELEAQVEETLKVEQYQKTNPFGTSQKILNA